MARVKAGRFELEVDTTNWPEVRFSLYRNGAHLDGLIRFDRARRIGDMLDHLRGFLRRFDVEPYLATSLTDRVRAILVARRKSEDKKRPKPRPHQRLVFNP